MRNSIEYKLTGEYALFTDPVTKIGGEKSTYHVPTYEALRGITEAIYWKPTLKWYIDKVRIMKVIQTQAKGVRTLKISGGNDLATYTYLHKVEYQVSAHFEWDEGRPDLDYDRDENKHHNIAKRCLSRGGRRDVFLGARECVGFVEPCTFGEGKGYYDEVREVDFGMMFHSFLYPTEQKPELWANLSRIVMKKGIIEFERPQECKFTRFVRNMVPDTPKTVGLAEFEDMDLDAGEVRA